MLNLKFLDQKDKTVYFNSPEGKLDIYIPKIFFEQELAEEYGSEIMTIGIFQFKYFPNKNKSTNEIYQIEIPENIFFSYSDLTETKDVLNDELEEDSYIVYTLYHGDMFIKNVDIAQSFTNTENLVKLHFTGKIPSSVKYSSIPIMYMESMETNKCDLNIPSLLIECMTAELARSKKNINIAFRQEIGKSTSVSEFDFRPVGIKTLALLNSTFTAFTSENTKNILTQSIARTRTGVKEKDSPLEPVIKY